MVILQGVGLVSLAVCTLAKKGGEDIFSIEKVPQNTKPQNTTKFGQHSDPSLIKPLDSKYISVAQIESYIKQYSTIALEEMRVYKIPSSIIIAQGIIESRAGTSILATKNKNHFGIKCFRRDCARGHCSNYEDDHHKDYFKIYEREEESWRDHSKFLKQERYASLFLCGSDYKAWARGLQKTGYATDINYAKKIIDVIEKYQLYQLDKK